MPKRVVLIPVYNEEEHIEGLLARLRQVYDEDVIFVDDGSADCSPALLKRLETPSTRIIIQAENRGYGATLLRGFSEAIAGGYEYVITMDSDGQHRPDWIPAFFKEIGKGWDIVSGSRYREETGGDGPAPEDRRQINRQITALLNEITGFGITDAFCGFKAYRASALAKLDLSSAGYSMPLQLWIQAKALGLSVTELPVSRIYDDPNRRFGGELDNPRVRLAYYLETIQQERSRWNV